MMSWAAFVGFELLCVVGLGSSALAAGIPNECLASFAVKDKDLTSDVNWMLGASTSAKTSCAAAELLREKLFVAGGETLGAGDLVGTPAAAQTKAKAAYANLEAKIRALPGEDAPGTVIAAGGYLFSKYQFASCILSSELEGGTCWGLAARFVMTTSGFLGKLYKDQSAALKKQEVLSALSALKPTIDAAAPGKADVSGAYTRWVSTQTNLCRAIQQTCLK